jgi:hypothetical protein
VNNDDLIKGIRLIERLKCGLLQWLARLFQALYNGPGKMIIDALSSLILYCYLLSKRVGISFNRLDRAIQEKARACLQADNQQEHGIPAEELVDFLRYRESLRG